MKVFFPRHIDAGFFSVNIQVGPLTLNILQFIIVAAGVALTFSTAVTLINKGVDRLMAAMIASPILIIFIVVAFFRFSELTLIPFIAKMIRTYFLDATQKFQVNYERPDNLRVNILYLKSSESTQTVQIKETKFDKEKVKKLRQTKLWRKNKAK